MLVYLRIRNELRDLLQRRTAKNQTGAALAEYALLVGLIAVVAIAVMTTLGTSIRDKFTEIVGALGG
jgi:pilus assembly protein Flp/PilA